MPCPDNLTRTPYLKLPKVSLIYFSVPVWKTNERKCRCSKTKKLDCVRTTQPLVKLAHCHVVPAGNDCVSYPARYSCNAELPVPSHPLLSYSSYPTPPFPLSFWWVNKEKTSFIPPDIGKGSGWAINGVILTCWELRALLQKRVSQAWGESNSHCHPSVL